MSTLEQIDKILSLVPYSASAGSFVRLVGEASNNKEALFEDIRSCRIDETKCRFNVWRMLMGVVALEADLSQKTDQLNTQRAQYRDKKQQAYSGVAPAKKEAVTIPKNPLMKAMIKTPKVEENDDQFLKDQIRKDVERTYQQIQFFQQEHILKLLSTILFVWCKRNPDVSYKQGMNEVLASVVYVYFQQAYHPTRAPEGLQSLNEELKNTYILFNNIEHAEPDIFCVFETIMNIQNHMYKTETDSNLKGVINPNSKNNTPILQRIITIIDQKLKSLDIELFRTIKLQDVQTKTFLLRWIRCMHTREFSLENSFLIWDSIFLDYYECPSSREKSQFEFIDAMCIAMFIYMRSLALSRETAYEILQIYQKYPNLKKGGYLEELISLAWSLCEALRQPASLAADWVGQESSKNNSKLQFLKTRDPKNQPKPEKSQKPNPIVSPLKSTKQPSPSQLQSKPTEPEKKQQKPLLKPTPVVQQPTPISNQAPPASDEPENGQSVPGFNFSLTLRPLQWHTLVDKLQKSLALNTDEQSRKYTLEGIEILKAKVEIMQAALDS